MNIVARTCIGIYRFVISPLIGARCRFHPSCSAYAHEAFVRYPWWAALKLSTRRLFKCHPWNEGGVDFVPERGAEE